MNAFLAEAVGTMLLVLLGDGVVAGVLLERSKGQNSGWIVITIGWGVAVAMGVYAVGRISGAHLNPAVTIALASHREFSLGQRAGLHRRAARRRVCRRHPRLDRVPPALGVDPGSRGEARRICHRTCREEHRRQPDH